MVGVDLIRRNRGRVRTFQNALKIFILVYISWLAVLHQTRGVMGAPPIHAFCPFGGLESLFKLVVSGDYIKKIFPSSFVLLAATILMAIFLRRGFCGWICPLGTLQEFFTYLGRKLKIRQNPLPEKFDRYLKYLKFVGLIVIVYYSWKMGELVFNAYDPWAAWAHIPEGFGELMDEFPVGTTFLVMGLLGSIWVPQNWCKYFCPMGAFLAIISKLSPTRIVRNDASCINCHLCSKLCPVSIEVSRMEEVRDSECVQCGDCISECPVPGTLEYRTVKSLKIPFLVYGIISVILFFGPIYVAKGLHLWCSGFSSIESVLVDDEGVLNPKNIKGSMTLLQVSRGFDIPVSRLRMFLDLPDEVGEKVFLKKLAKKYSFRVNEFRHAVARYLKEKNQETGLRKDNQ